MGKYHSKRLVITVYIKGNMVINSKKMKAGEIAIHGPNLVPGLALDLMVIFLLRVN